MNDTTPNPDPAGDPPGTPSGDTTRDDALIEAAMRQAMRAPGRPGRGPIVQAELLPAYTIVREIHRGGQGVVYEAVQKSTKRTVAIKVLREGVLAGDKDRQRFEREIEILASLNHPNIVKVVDSGTAGGNFYYAMDYVEGQGLDAWMSVANRPVEDVVGLFLKIGEAVNAAHMKGVIHRDLKPGNIRVDASDEPHILDFGLAKTSAGSSIGENTPALTITGQFVGSLPWASPEQALGDNKKIDVRTDVYSLGVMLYQALTGRFPYEVVGNMREVLENIQRAMPSRPSTIRRQINDEVETILLKCLSKEPERRYQSAGDLARDLNRYLAGEPIEAKRDSGWYLLSKSLARYRYAVLVVAALVTTAVVGGIVSFGYWQEAQRERDRALELVEERDAALKNVTTYALFLDGMLSGIDPDQARGADTSLLKTMLATAAGRAEMAFKERPVEGAAIRETIARTYTAIGDFEAARPHVDAVVEARKAVQRELPLGYARALMTRALWLQAQGKFEESQEPAQEALDIRRQFAKTQGNALGDSEDVAESLRVLAQAARGIGRPELAEELHIEGIAVLTRLAGSSSVLLVEPLSSLGRLYFEQRRFNEALPALEKALQIAAGVYPRDSVPVITLKNTLGSVLRERDGVGDLTAAGQLVGEVVASARKIFSPDHPLLAEALNRQGLVLRQEGNYTGAERSLRESLGVWRAAAKKPEFTSIETLSVDDLKRPSAAAAVMNLGLVFRDQGKLKEARFWHERAATIIPEVFGKNSGQMASVMNHMAELLRLEGKSDEAVTAAQAALDARLALKHEGRPEHADSLVTLAKARVSAGDATGGEASARSALEIYTRLFGPGSTQAATAAGVVGEALLAQGKTQEAKLFLQTRYDTFTSLRGEDHPLTRAAKAELDKAG